jgi:hypothetical protein
MHFLVICMGLAPGLQSAAPESDACEGSIDTNAIMQQVSQIFAPHLPRGVALVKKEITKKDPYLEDAKALRDMVLEEYKRGELGSIGGGRHADVELIEMRVINPQELSHEGSDLREKYARLRYKAALRVSSDPDNDLKVHKASVRLGMMRATNAIRESLGVYAPITTKRGVIFLNGENPTGPIDNQNLTTFHELAHAFDPNGGKSMEELDLDCYSWLKEDVKQCDPKEILLHEWHADKQAIAWLKKYKPDEAKKVIEYFEYCQAEGREVPEGYPPIAVQLAWLRDPNL